MGCCRSRPEEDRTNAHVNLLQERETEAGEGETELGSCEGGLSGADESLHDVQKVEQQLSREEISLAPRPLPTRGEGPGDEARTCRKK